MFEGTPLSEKKPLDKQDAHRMSIFSALSRPPESAKEAELEGIEERWFMLGKFVWVISRYGPCDSAKYEIQTRADNLTKLDESLRVSSNARRISNIKDGHRRQYNYSNIDKIVGVAVLPPSRREINGNKGTYGRRIRFRLTYVLVKWKGISTIHTMQCLEDGKGWEPRYQLLCLAGKKYKAQVDSDILKRCRMQDSQFYLWLEISGISSLSRSPTPLPGPNFYISEVEDSGPNRVSEMRSKTSQIPNEATKRESKKAEAEVTGVTKNFLGPRNLPRELVDRITFFTPILSKTSFLAALGLPQGVQKQESQYGLQSSKAIVGFPTSRRNTTHSHF